MKLYGKTLKFKRGITIQIALTYACNLSCEYCSLHIPTGKRPKAPQSSLSDWQRYIKNFPIKIKEVYVSGGEPSLIKWMPDLVNWLLDQKYHVTLFTDLYNPSLILQIKRSYRFQIVSTYHHSDSMLRFDSAYLALKNKYRIEVDEIGEKHLPYSRVKPFIDEEGLKDNEFRISPDLQIYLSCYEHFKQKSL